MHFQAPSLTCKIDPIVGTSSLITFVESAIGIAAGGRTGIVAIVCGLMMFSSLFFRDLATLIPVEATSGVLVFVLYLILRPYENGGDSRAIELNKADHLIGLVMAGAGLVTFSLEIPMCIGFLAYTIMTIWRERHFSWMLTGSSLVLVTIIVLQRQWFL